MKRKATAIIGILFIVFIIANSIQAKPCSLVFGYCPDKSSTTPAGWSVNSIDWDALTHVMDTFAMPLTNGGVDSTSFLRGATLVNAAHTGNTRAMFSVGGATSSDANFTSSSSTYRAAFVTNLVNIMTAGNYDGIDVDWEFPYASDKLNFTGMMQALYTAVKAAPNGFFGTPRQLTFYITTGYYDAGYEFDKLGLYCDYMIQSGYDWYDPANAPLHNTGTLTAMSGLTFENSVDGFAQRVLSAGFPANKFILGLPFYSTPGAVKWGVHGAYTSYNTLYEEGNYSGQWFNDVRAYTAKYDYIKSEGRPGIAIWEISMIYPLTDLWTAIKTQSCLGIGSPTITPTVTKTRTPPPSATVSPVYSPTISATITRTHTRTPIVSATVTPTVNPSGPGADVRNVTVAGGCYNTGTTLSVSFEAKKETTASSYFSVGIIFSKDDAVLEYTDDAVYTNNGSVAVPETTGHIGAWQLCTDTNWNPYTVVVNVPASYGAGPVHVFVAVMDNAQYRYNISLNDIQNYASASMSKCGALSPTVTKTITATMTRTATRTITRTATATVSSTVTGTITRTATQTGTPQPTATITPVNTKTVTGTITMTATAAATLTVTKTATATATKTSTTTATKSVTATVTKTITADATHTVTATVTKSVTATATKIATATVTGTATPSITATISRTATQTLTVTNSPQATQSITPTITKTNTSTVTPTITMTNTRTVTKTATQSVTATVTFTISATSTAVVSATPTIDTVLTKTITPSVTATYTVTLTGTITKTATVVNTATTTPTVTQTLSATITRTGTPSVTGTVSLTFTQTITVTGTAPPTATVTGTHTPVNTGTATQTITETGTQTSTLTLTPILSATQTHTVTLTQTQTQVYSETVTATFTQSATQAPAETETVTATHSATASETGTMTNTPVDTATLTNTPTLLETFTQTSTPEQSLTSTPTQAQTLTATPVNTQAQTYTVTQTVTATQTMLISQTITPTLLISATMTASETAVPAFTHTVTRTVIILATATMTETHLAGNTPTPTPTYGDTSQDADRVRIEEALIMPNPAGADGKTGINIKLNTQAQVRVKIYTSAYRLVVKIEAGVFKNAMLPLNVKTVHSGGLAGGVYFICVEADAGSRGKDRKIVKLVVMK